MFGPGEEFRVLGDFGSLPITQENSVSTNSPISTSYEWFGNYIDNLQFSDTSVAKVEELSNSIGGLISESTQLFEDTSVWGKGRLRKGMVVGSIQSGKTASMMGVIGKCLDKGTQIIVLLSGTKTSLWHQTLLRFYDELDCIEDRKLRSRLRLILPRKYIVNSDHSVTFYSSQESRIRQTLEKKDKCLIFVIPKHKDHINDVASVLHRAIDQSHPKNRHILVIDDESDDASILDAQKTKSTPYAITRLWSGTDESVHFNRTANDFLYATYLAYTATPQANILQVETNPLAPTDFIFRIETPGESDTSITYFEPGGIRKYYTGGDIFYEQDFSDYPEKANFCQELYITESGNVDLSDGLRAYIVGAAIHLIQSDKLYSELPEDYQNFDDAKSNQVDPFSMVFHPSADTPEHFEGKQQIVHWLNNGTNIGFSYDPNNKNNQDIDPAKFNRHFLENEELWQSELNSFQSTTEFCNSKFVGGDYESIEGDWSKISSIILNEIVPNIKIRVINSKAGGESMPKFSPVETNKRFSNTPDKLSIFVAGNVLSRGLTIEGLAVSIFARESIIPAADTQMQMQRWFGYRGKILPLCRIFVHANQLQLFRQYHQSDKSLKERISKIENLVDQKLENLPYILEGDYYLSTAKTATTKLPLRPASYLQFGIIEENPEIRKSNLNKIEEFLQNNIFKEIKIANQRKGYVSDEPVSSLVIADLLDSLEFSRHRPSNDSPDYNRWEEYANIYSSGAFVKKIDSSVGPLLGTQRCPYTVSAFLRFWDHVSTPENSLKEDLFVWPEATLWRDRFTNSPDFFISIRSGTRGQLSFDTLGGEIMINAVKRSRSPNSRYLVNNVWGTASGSSNQYDDKLFDYHHSDIRPIPKDTPDFAGIPDKFRPRDHPGQLAIYFIQQDDGSIDLGFGIAIPSGSPEHIRSMRG